MRDLPVLFACSWCVFLLACLVYGDSESDCLVVGGGGCLGVDLVDELGEFGECGPVGVEEEAGVVVAEGELEFVVEDFAAH